MRNYHHVNHPRFLLYTIAFALGASDTKVKSGNSILEGLGVLGEAGCAAGGRAEESACVALTRMGTTYLQLPFSGKRQVYFWRVTLLGWVNWKQRALLE
jgi:hypothetical protein